MSDEYFDGERITVIGCSRCGETRVAKFPHENRKIRMFDGVFLCNLCLNNELTEKLIELLERAEHRATAHAVYEDGKLTYYPEDKDRRR